MDQITQPLKPPLPPNWHSLTTGGSDATAREIADLYKSLTTLTSHLTRQIDRLDQLRSQLEHQQDRQQAAETLLAAIGSRLDEVEYLISEELMARLSRSTQLQICAVLETGTHWETTLTPSALPTVSAAASPAAEAEG